MAMATDLDWLEALEEKVRAAAASLHELRDQNAALRQRIAELEERLAGERIEVRQRVERLTRQLEELAG